MNYEVINIGGSSDKSNRELIVVMRNGKLVARAIRFKITMSDAFKTKYPKASEIDHTRNRTILLKWLNSLYMGEILPGRAPVVTLIYEGKRYFYSKVSGQWWDNLMLGYWNQRVFAVHKYDENRKMRCELEYDNLRKYINVVLAQNVVDKPIEPISLKVYHNNDLILDKTISIDNDATRVSVVTAIMNEVELNDSDIYCVIYNGEYIHYEVNRAKNSLHRMLPKMFLIRAADFEAEHGTTYKWRPV